VTLKRRYKRRYILVLSGSSAEELLSDTKSKMVNMFGYINAHKASVKLMEKLRPNLYVFRCVSEFSGEVLCALTLIDSAHPAVVLDMSGTLRSLRTRFLLEKHVIESALGASTKPKC
jgi:RNase P/RNase MRP subunit POP5